MRECKCFVKKEQLEFSKFGFVTSRFLQDINILQLEVSMAELANASVIHPRGLGS
jgi:hypothetical protein